MIVTTFPNGSSAHILVHGGDFCPIEGDKYLFEFPDGEVLEGTVERILDEPSEGLTALVGIYDRDSETISLEV